MENISLENKISTKKHRYEIDPLNFDVSQKIPESLIKLTHDKNSALRVLKQVSPTKRIAAGTKSPNSHL